MRGLEEWVYGLQKSVMNLTSTKTVGTLEIACNFFKRSQVETTFAFLSGLGDWYVLNAV